MVAAALPVVGCKEVTYGDRVPLAGSITKGGEPIQENATIIFDLLPGQDGHGSAGEVYQSRFSIPAEAGPTPGRKYKVIVRTAPGIPAEGTPRDQIRLAEQYETTIELPSREEGVEDLEIAFP